MVDSYPRGLGYILRPFSSAAPQFLNISGALSPLSPVCKLVLSLTYHLKLNNFLCSLRWIG